MNNDNESAELVLTRITLDTSSYRGDRHSLSLLMLQSDATDPDQNLSEMLDVFRDYELDELARDSVHRYAVEMAKRLSTLSNRTWLPGDVVEVDGAPLVDPYLLDPRDRMALFLVSLREGLEAARIT